MFLILGVGLVIVIEQSCRFTMIELMLSICTNWTHGAFRVWSLSWWQWVGLMEADEVGMLVDEGILLCCGNAMLLKSKYED
jgi:hypothetical protein